MTYGHDQVVWCSCDPDATFGLVEIQFGANFGLVCSIFRVVFQLIHWQTFWYNNCSSIVVRLKNLWIIGSNLTKYHLGPIVDYVAHGCCRVILKLNSMNFSMMFIAIQYEIMTTLYKAYTWDWGKFWIRWN